MNKSLNQAFSLVIYLDFKDSPLYSRTQLLNMETMNTTTRYGAGKILKANCHTHLFPPLMFFSSSNVFLILRIPYLFPKNYLVSSGVCLP